MTKKKPTTGERITELEKLTKVNSHAIDMLGRENMLASYAASHKGKVMGYDGRRVRVRDVRYEAYDSEVQARIFAVGSDIYTSWVPMSKLYNVPRSAMLHAIKMLWWGS